MDRRQIIATVAGPVFGGGIASVIASLQPALAAYHGPLSYLGTGMIVAALTTWSVLWGTAERASAENRKYVTLTEVGRVLYDTGERSLREAMAEGVPSVFRTLDAAGSAYAAAAAKELGLQFYGRRGEGVRIEPIDNDEAEPGAFIQAFGKLEKMHEVSIERKHLPKVRRYYKVSGSAPAKK
jgi:phosphosulfolactate synthase (CoM biosynthesis protein A)